MFLISEGSKFHNLGAAIVNDLSPIVAADFFSDGVNNIALLDRRQAKDWVYTKVPCRAVL